MRREDERTRYTGATATCWQASAGAREEKGRSPKAPAVHGGTVQTGWAQEGDGRIVGAMRRGDGAAAGNEEDGPDRPDHSGAVRKGSAADAWGLKRTRRAREAEAARSGVKIATGTKSAACAIDENGGSGRRGNSYGELETTSELSVSQRDVVCAIRNSGWRRNDNQLGCIVGHNRARSTCRRRRCER